LSNIEAIVLKLAKRFK